MPEALPWSFHDDRIEPNPNWNNSSYSNIETTYSLETPDNLIECYSVYKQHFREPQNIIYPACGWDISLRTAFPSAYITFVDPNVGYTTAIREQVSNAIVHCMDFEDYTGMGFDLGVIFNAWCKHDILPSHIKIWGHLLSEWPGWNFDAEDYFTHPKTRLMGVFLRAEDWNLMFSQEDMESYLKKTWVNEFGKWDYEKTASFYVFEIIE
jgi:hypothetical protein